VVKIEIFNLRNETKATVIANHVKSYKLNADKFMTK